MAWTARVDRIAVIGNILTFKDGRVYTWIGLDLGPLVYYPAVNAQRFTQKFLDGCYEAHEALRALRDHHISLAYLPEIQHAQLEGVLREVSTRLRQWKEKRWNGYDKMHDFVPLRKTFAFG